MLLLNMFLKSMLCQQLTRLKANKRNELCRKTKEQLIKNMFKNCMLDLDIPDDVKADKRYAQAVRANKYEDIA